MMPFIRSLAELMAITSSRDSIEESSTINDKDSSTIDSGQRKRYIRSLFNDRVKLPNLPKTQKRKKMKNNESIVKFFESLDYNNQILSTYDLTLMARQNKRNEKDAA